MLHSWLTNDELERAVYIEPTNAAARAEMLARVPGLVALRDQTILDLEAELEIERRERGSEIANMEEETQQAERHASELQAELDAATDRIAELTACAGIV